MSKKNAFASVMGGAPAPSSTQGSPDMSDIARRPASVPPGVAALGRSLKATNEQMVHVLTVDQIITSDRHDRFSVEDEQMDALIASIKESGQQIPVAVRPDPKGSGKYEIIYGRRRLHALTTLGMTVKAFVRELDDTAAIIASGQENNLRHDPSFIEKACWANDLLSSDVERSVVVAAMGTSEGTLSQMKSVCTVVPMDVISSIGPAPRIGRRRWLEAVEMIKTHKIFSADALTPEVLSAEDSSDRFELWTQEMARIVKTMNQQAAKPKVVVKKRAVAAPTGEKIAAIEVKPGTATIKVDKSQAEFADWLGQHGDDVMQQLFEQFQASK